MSVVLRTRIKNVCVGAWRRIARFAGDLFVVGYDRFFASRERTRREAFRTKCGPFAGGGSRISVVITHFNRGESLHRSLHNILSHPVISEIVIFDDFSDDSNYAKLVSFLSSLKRSDIRIVKAKSNLKALRAKRAAVEACSSPWVLLLDSDNTVFRNFLDAIFQMPSRDDSTIYCAAFAFPYFDFRTVAGRDIDFDGIRKYAAAGTLNRVYFFNDGNYLVPKSRYLEVSHSVGHPCDDAADTMLFNYFWVSRGGKMKFLPGTSYLHRIEATGRWMTNSICSKMRVTEIVGRLKKGKRADPEYAWALGSGK